MSLLEAHSRPPAQEAEKLPIRRAAAIGVLALAIFAAGVTWVGFRLAADRRALGGMPPIPSEVGQYDIAGVHQRPFDLADLAQRKRRKQQQQLTSYGWVDRQKGQIHIPIDVAMERRVQEERR